MAAKCDKDFSSRLALIQKRLKEERLFIRQQKDLMRSLNENLSKSSKELFHLSWSTQQHWRNLDRLVSGSRVFPSECSNTSKLIECASFVDGSKCLGYQEMRYGEFLDKLRQKPNLVAWMLMSADQLKSDTQLIARLLLSSLYGGCLFKEEERNVLLILQFLVDEQVVKSDDPLSFFCSPKSNAFSVVLKMFTSFLFSAKLYQTAALHGAVMQVIVDDNVYLDLEVTKMLSRFPPKLVRQKFGEPGTAKANKKIGDYMENLQTSLFSLCKKFLRSLQDKIYCFPPNLKWLVGQIYHGLVQNSSLGEKNVKAIIGYLLINYLVCPAILNPEPYGINTDATVTEIARHNLSQVASILSALALSGCGTKDQKMARILERFEPNIISMYVDAILHGCEDFHPLEEKEIIIGIRRSAILITERELKSLIFFMKRIQQEKWPKLMEAGLDEVLDLLPPLPRRWTKPKSQQRLAQSLPVTSLDTSGIGQSPGPVARQKRLTIGKKHNSLYAGNKESNILVKDEYENLGKVPEDSDFTLEDDIERLMKSLGRVITDDEEVLVITLGNVTGEEPGMLSEEKVLGLKSTVPTPATFDMEKTDEDKRKRASTLMLDALKDLNIGSQEDIENMKNIVNQIDERVSEESDTLASSDEKSYDTLVNDGTRQLGGDLLLRLDADSSETDATLEHSLTETEGRNLAIFDVWGDHTPNEVDKSFDPFTATTPMQAMDEIQAENIQRPINSGSLSFSSPFADNFSPFSDASSRTSGNEGNVTVDDLMDFGFGEEAKEVSVEDDSSSSPSFPRTYSETSQALKDAYQSSKRPSQVSLESVLGGITTVLKTAGVQHSSTQPIMIDEIPEVSESVEDHMESKMHSSRSRTTTAESSVSDEFAVDAWESVNKIQDVDQGRQPTRSEEAKEVFLESDIIERSATDVGDHRGRKKSSGFRIKDKIVSGFRQARAKSDGHHLKKDLKRFQSKAVEILPSKEEKVANETDGALEKDFPVTGKTAKDISEDILQKYRNLTPKSPGLMEDDDTFQGSGTEVDPFSEVDWDENFKFEDAKRKLRIVLCVADRSHFPCGSSKCSQLLMTFLQAQLAEAINLQDRSFVAQLHETLRSIRQLPPESCDQLLDALEEDYKQRSPYISYLIRSQQNLLSAVSHLEQTKKKIERDKNICSKYFTTVCVRLFLETPEKRREVALFGSKFESTNMLDEKCALVEEFLDQLYNEMAKDPTWLSATEDQWTDCQMATERSLMSAIYKDAFYPNGETDIENDRIFHEHITRLCKFVSVNHKSLQIPKAYQKEAPWPSAQTELLMINAYKTPVDKLRCIHRCCVTIMNLLSMASDDSSPGADDFVPVLVFVVIRANPPNLLSTKQYVNNFYEKRLSGEEYYCWMQFCAAIEFIKSLDDRR